MRAAEGRVFKAEDFACQPFIFLCYKRILSDNTCSGGLLLNSTLMAITVHEKGFPANAGRIE